MWILKIIKKIASKIKIFSSTLTKKSFFKKWKAIKPKDKDILRTLFKKDKDILRFKNKINKTLKDILKKQMNNISLSSYEKELLKNYEELFINDETPMVETKPINLSNTVKSTWISIVEYYPKTKKVRLLIENQNGVKKWYNFYNVPKTKYLALVELGGKYMWDYFGRHYSTNPLHWVRRRL